MCVKEIGFGVMVKIYLIRDGDQQWDNKHADGYERSRNLGNFLVSFSEK